MIALRNEIRTMARRIENERAKEKDVMENVPMEDEALLEDTLHKIQESSVFSSSRMNNIGVVDQAMAMRMAKTRPCTSGATLSCQSVRLHALMSGTQNICRKAPISNSAHDDAMPISI